LDNNITQAENEQTILAKGNQTNTQCGAINSAQVKNKKPAIGLAQHGCNAAYSLGMTISQTLKKISNNKHIGFAKNKKVHLFDKAETPIMITYDSGVNGHYISKKDRHKAGLPIIRKSTRWVGVANGGVNQAKYVTQLPFKALSAQATQADTFQDFPSSLMSVGKTADDGTISITLQLHSKKVKDIYMTMYDIRETMFLDQTGQFPTCSQSGNKYIMVLVEINSNAILVEPMKSRKDTEMIQAYNALLLRLKGQASFSRSMYLTTKFWRT
jgi:hypothetical protein